VPRIEGKDKGRVPQGQVLWRVTKILYQIVHGLFLEGAQRSSRRVSQKSLGTKSYSQYPGLPRQIALAPKNARVSRRRIIRRGGKRTQGTVEEETTSTVISQKTAGRNGQCVELTEEPGYGEYVRKEKQKKGT
jgi:hypothetical protein